MSSKRSPGPPGAERVAQATALIRALTGVLDAFIEADATGIQSVAVVADASLSAWEVTRNVQSALLASLGLSIDTAIMEIRRPEVGAQGGSVAGEAPTQRRPESGPAGESPAPSSPNGRPVLHGGNGKTNGGPKTNGKANGNGRSDGAQNGRLAVPGAVVLETVPPAAKPRSGGSVARLELESRVAGRVMCRVVVTTADRIAAGESEGVDTPAGRLEVAARAVIAASPMTGLDLDGVRLVDLAGRKYVIAAVRQWGGRELVYRAEVAPVAASPEAAAAQAALNAILQ